MLEKEKQLKINRLAQEVCALSLSQQASKGQSGDHCAQMGSKGRPFLHPSPESKAAPPTSGSSELNSSLDAGLRQTLVSWFRGWV